MDEWQLVAALAGVIIAGLSLAFGMWKFIHLQIQKGDKANAESIKAEADRRDKEVQMLDERIRIVKDSTPTHDDIKRVEG